VSLAAGLAALVGSAVATSWLAVRVSRLRRRRRLNEALHELRRPLQYLALADEGPASAWIEPAVRALAELDAVVNDGEPRAADLERLCLAQLLGGCRARWQARGGISFELGDPELPLLGDRLALGAALDNLIANAVEHGSGPVLVRAAGCGAEALVAVESEAAESADGGPERAGSDPRRGHGLRIAGRIASEHGGRLQRERPTAPPSALVLPASPPPGPAAGSGP
jgi:signal transduction histidine kinase